MNKILFILPSLNKGGAEKVIFEIFNNLEGYDNKLIVFENNTSIKNDNIISYKNISLKKNIFNLVRTVRKEKPDLVISSHFHINIFLIILKYIYKFKIVVRQPFTLSNNNSKFNWIKRFSKLYKYSDMVIFQTKNMKEDFILTSKTYLNNSTVIYNPIQIDKSNSYKNEKFFLAVGSLKKVKNYSYLIKRYAEEYQNDKSLLPLYIIGEGPERENLNNLIDKYHISKKVILLGQKENLTYYYLNAKALIICSQSEGLPNVLLEAISNKCNVIVRKHPGGTEEVLKKIGLLNNYVDEIDFKCSNYVATDSSHINQLETYFGVQNIMKKYKKSFNNLLKDRKD